jgi:hypothetical protein
MRQRVRQTFPGKGNPAVSSLIIETILRQLICHSNFILETGLNLMLKTF